MSEAEFCSDDGGYLAEQDFYAEECEYYKGECNICPHKYRCESSDYNQRRLGRYKKER